MAEGLSFLGWIEQALRNPDPRTALREAFERILAHSQRSRHDFLQFASFMEIVRMRLEEQNGFLAAEPGDALQPAPPGHLILSKDEVLVKEIPIRPGKTESIGELTPGLYKIFLDTGRALWMEALTEEDLLWEVAYPQAPLEMAADTGSFSPRPTRQWELLGGDILLEVLPGVEAGRLNLEFPPPRTWNNG